jgi:predicted AlkP superfamily phosphohydrolase/phosphomutase
MKKPKRVAVIGLDCAIPHLIDQHIAEGHLPTFKRLFENGVVADNCLVPFPTITPPNWATIATGAWPGTHGITDFWLPHEPGMTPENVNTHQSFGSERVEAEYIWDAADKAGKKCIVLNYPGAWPSHMENGIVVGGCGTGYGQFRDYMPHLDTAVDVCSNQLITTGLYPRAIRGSFSRAQGWANLREPGEDPLEMVAELAFPGALERPASTSWHLLARASDGVDYDRITLSPTKDMQDAFCTLGVGEWSPKIVTKIAMQDGTEREVMFRCKLIELSEDTEDFRLFLTAMIDTGGFISPPEVAAKIVSPGGIPVTGGGMNEYELGWIDLDTYVECCQFHDEWLGDTAVSLLGLGEWDLFFMHSHPIDWTYHVLMSDMDPATSAQPARRSAAWKAHLQVYESQDRMVGRIVEAAGEDTLIVLVSDHGATADGPLFNPQDALVPAGLTVLNTDADAAVTNSDVPTLAHYLALSISRADASQSKAIAQRTCYVYVNLKGRDSEGIVAPEDYEQVQHEIIDALYAYVDPGTGKRPVALALAKEDARLLGLYGDRIGDVVYATYPYFGSQHGASLPTARWGIGSLKGLLALTGPGIKHGTRLQRTVHLTDIVPTICHLLDFPLPQHAEGAVLYQAFRDPNFKQAEIAKLMQAATRMERALQRDVREPWDKHDCG